MKIGIIGHFGHNKKLLNGQTVKTKSLADGLRKYTKYKIYEVDTSEWRSDILRLLLNILRAFYSCDALIMMPAHNGVKVFTPLLSLINVCFKRKLYYSVIGGWLPELIKNKSIIKYFLGRFQGIWVETKTMNTNLKELNLLNCYVIPNFKDVDIVPEEHPFTSVKRPFRFVVFSRIIPQKGIKEAVDVINKVNMAYGHLVAELDIYGNIPSEHEIWFKNLKKNFPSYIKYKGEVDPDKSVGVLKDYFCLLFPTRFVTEGIPGTIIDAYSAGVPVIASKWNSFHDIVYEKKTGYGYSWEDYDKFFELVYNVVYKPEMITNLKTECIKVAKDFSTKRNVQIISNILEEDTNNLIRHR